MIVLKRVSKKHRFENDERFSASLKIKKSMTSVGIYYCVQNFKHSAKPNYAHLKIYKYKFISSIKVST